MLENLISEVIGILITVLFVDRLLAWRERRRWRTVRDAFLSDALDAALDLVTAWEAWLYVIDKLPHDRKTRFRKGEMDTRELHRFLGDPIGDDLLDFTKHCSRKEIDRVGPLLDDYLKRTDLPPIDDSSSITLCAGLRPAVQRLRELIAQYSMVVDPHYCGPVSRLTLHIRELETRRSDYDKRNQNLDRAADLADGGPYRNVLPGHVVRDALMQTFALFDYFREYRATEGDFEERAEEENERSWANESWVDRVANATTDFFRSGLGWLVPSYDRWRRRKEETPWERYDRERSEFIAGRVAKLVEIG
jgi:hypothetical protein